jgi:hypothetical protein
MKTRSTILSLIAVTCGLTSATAALAHPGWVGHRHYVAPAPYCAAYGCSAEATITGPAGQTATRSGSASCADGTCSRSGTVTGPNGDSVTFNRSISR